MFLKKFVIINTVIKMEIKNRYIKIALGSILAAFAVALASYVYMMGQVKFSQYKLISAIFFCVGFFLISAFSWYLYTGKIGYLIHEKRLSYVIDLLIIFVVNLVVCILLGMLMGLLTFNTNIESSSSLDVIKHSVSHYLQKKINNGPYTIISALFCGILIHLTAIAWKDVKSMLLKSLILIFAITTFVLSGFDHVIANTFYFSIGLFHVDYNIGYAALSVFYALIGNSLGSIIIDVLYRISKNKKEILFLNNNEEENN